jgi:dihydroorotate dehydrogenase (NAD+) catalytic subunit
VRPVALAQVADVAARVGIPVIGMGGIATGADARDFLAVGATAIAVGTESFRDPSAGSRIRRELAALAPATGEAAAADPPAAPPRTPATGETAPARA